MSIRLPFIPVALLAIAASARADSMTVQGMGPQKITVTGFAGDKIQYQTARGDPADKEYDKIQQLVVDNEPALSAAEAAFAGGQKEASVDAYAKAIRATNTPWVKLFAARRLTDAAGPNGRFEPRLLAYLAVLQAAPADAGKLRPDLPSVGSKLLDVAVTETETALKTPNLSDAAKTALLSFLTDVHRRRGDDAAVMATVERLTKVSPTAANNPAVQGQLIGLKITQAKAAVEKKDYLAAARLINDNRAAIVDPAQQADALYVLAQVKLATADTTDKAAQQDAALAFMRVVALANPLPGRPNVLASLRATAGILERLGNTAEAVKIYTQIVRDYAAEPAAVSIAKADLDRLKSK